jgi:uncharacterized SAM-binding protein YcdF (DUF218 family)
MSGKHLKIWLKSAAVGILLLVLAVAGFRCLGGWLVVSDPLERADAVVVFGGHVPFRAMEAASIYRDGFARQVWLTRGKLHESDEALIRLGFDVIPEHETSARVLKRLGVPENAIRVLDGKVQNTVEEVQLVLAEARRAGGARLILITSKYHTRRVRLTWRALAGDSLKAAVHFTADDPFNPDRWWRHTGDAMAVARETFGILNVWAGLPIRSERW